VYLQVFVVLENGTWIRQVYDPQVSVTCVTGTCRFPTGQPVGYLQVTGICCSALVSIDVLRYFQHSHTLYRFQQPGKPHYVLGVEPAITSGRHFYARSTIALTCYTIIHTFMLNRQVTNQQHDSTRPFLRRMMSMWQDQYVTGKLAGRK
jgi:hypothetical protein